MRSNGPQYHDVVRYIMPNHAPVAPDPEFIVLGDTLQGFHLPGLVKMG